jgi:hypothetical protein
MSRVAHNICRRATSPLYRSITFANHQAKIMFQSTYYSKRATIFSKSFYDVDEEGGSQNEEKNETVGVDWDWEEPLLPVSSIATSPDEAFLLHSTRCLSASALQDTVTGCPAIMARRTTTTGGVASSTPNLTISEHRQQQHSIRIRSTSAAAGTSSKRKDWLHILGMSRIPRSVLYLSSAPDESGSRRPTFSACAAKSMYKRLQRQRQTSDDSAVVAKTPGCTAKSKKCMKRSKAYFESSGVMVRQAKEQTTGMNKSSLHQQYYDGLKE